MIGLIILYFFIWYILIISLYVNINIEKLSLVLLYALPWPITLIPALIRYIQIKNNVCRENEENRRDKI